mgnify:CR=1 FL=1
MSAGEIGQIDAQGHVWLMGREDRMITVGDESVFPEAVEACIAALPEVTECAVLPRADPKRGHHLVAIVAGAAPDPDLAVRIRATCRADLGAARTPKDVLWHADFPRLRSGKPDLIALRRWLEAQA